MAGNVTIDPMGDYSNTGVWHFVIKACEYIFPLQAVFGIFGNMMNIYVLCSKTMRGR